jgi:hypothetical protein
VQLRSGRGHAVKVAGVRVSILAIVGWMQGGVFVKERRNVL